MALFNFDSSAIQLQERSFDPIPAGTYIARVIESDLRPLKSGNGTGLNLQFEIIDGQFSNRRIFEQLNVQHSNQKTESIAQEQLAYLCKAVGVSKLQDTQQLHNIPLKIKVKVRKDETGQYGDSNSITGYESAPQAMGVSNQSAFQAQPKPAASAPWASARA